MVAVAFAFAVVVAAAIIAVRSASPTPAPVVEEMDPGPSPAEGDGASESEVLDAAPQAAPESVREHPVDPLPTTPTADAAAATSSVATLAPPRIVLESVPRTTLFGGLRGIDEHVPLLEILERAAEPAADAPHAARRLLIAVCALSVVFGVAELVFVRAVGSFFGNLLR